MHDLEKPQPISQKEIKRQNGGLEAMEKGVTTLKDMLMGIHHIKQPPEKHIQHIQMGSHREATQ